MNVAIKQMINVNSFAFHRTNRMLYKV